MADMPRRRWHTGGYQNNAGKLGQNKAESAKERVGRAECFAM